MKKIYLTLSGFLLIATAVFAQTTYASYPLDGNANDVAGNNLHGTISGSPATTNNRYSQNGKALDFDGINDYIDLPSDFDFPTRSIVLWFNASQIGSANGLNYMYTSDGPHIQNGLTNLTVYQHSSLGNVINLGVDDFNYYSSVNTNQWYQIAIVRTPSFVKYYINGVLNYTHSNPSGLASNNTVSSTAVIGADRGYLAKFFGKIDDVSIYDTEVSDSLVLNNYNSLKEVHEVDDKLNVFVQSGSVHYELPENLLLLVEQVNLFDVNGKQIAKDESQIDGVLIYEYLPAGTYFVSVQVKDGARPVVRKVAITE